MFDIGFWELTTIAVIALLVIGPDKLPGVARTAGKWVGRARRFVGDVKTDIDRELKQEELRKALAEDAGLDEIKQIMNTDDFTIEPEEISEPEYQVKAMPDTEKTSDDDFEENYDSPPGLETATEVGTNDIAESDKIKKESKSKDA